VITDFDSYMTLNDQGLCPSETAYCENCPKEEQIVCLLSCEHGQFYNEETGTCGECLTECKDGCVRATDCNPCSDILCSDCRIDDKNQEICNTCMADASLDGSGNCVCNDGFY
jgi:hypothetical protein